MFIVDAHEDIAYNALHNGRDIRRPVAYIRRREDEIAAARSCPLMDCPDLAMVSLPELRSGGVGLVFATIFTRSGAYETMARDGREQIGYYSLLASENPGVRIVSSRQQLDTLKEDWLWAATPDERPLGMVLLMEGADPVRDPAELEEWYRQGLRIIGPSWRGTRYAGGTGAPGPLTDLGRELLKEMERLGLVLDVSHLSDESFWEATQRFQGTVIASHSNCRSLVPGDRHLTDKMIQAIAERGGIIGAVMANPFLVAEWGTKNDTNLPVTLSDVVRHIDHICQLTGSAVNVGIGSDFDGGFGVESTPEEFDSVADLGKLADALTQAGYSDADITGIMGANWLRLLERALPAL
ncbi:MAG: dipeptidase [Ktedonobacterales bacterium]